MRFSLCSNLMWSRGCVVDKSACLFSSESLVAGGVPLTSGRLAGATDLCHNV